MIVETAHPVAGKVKGLGLPIRFLDGNDAASRPAPLLGEHTANVLRDLGYSAEEVSALQAQQAVFVR